MPSMYLALTFILVPSCAAHPSLFFSSSEVIYCPNAIQALCWIIDVRGGTLLLDSSPVELMQDKAFYGARR